MHNEGETRPCKRDGCDGMQVYHSNVLRPGSRSGLSSERDQIVWGGNQRGSAWVCDKDKKHVDWV